MDAPCTCVPSWEYSHPSNLKSSCALLLIGSLVDRDAGPSNCGIIEISQALIDGDLTWKFLNELGSYPNIDKFIWGIAN